MFKEASFSRSERPLPNPFEEDRGVIESLTKVRPVLRRIATNFRFDNFRHYFELEKVVKESGKDPITALNEWNYDPNHFMEDTKSDNCFDFAAYTQQELGKVGVQTHIIGMIPRNNFSPNQREYMVYRHTSLLADFPEAKGTYMFEPDWRVVSEIPLSKIGETIDFGERTFKTVSLDKERLVQETSAQSGTPWKREFSLRPILPESLKDVTKRLMRIPRSLDLVTPLGKDFYYLHFDPLTRTLSTNIKGTTLPEGFTPSNISDQLNIKLSNLFGIPNVREYLTQTISFIESLPENFWIQ